MSSRARVLRVIARLNVGGPALHAVLLTEQLDPKRYESLLVSGIEAPDEGSYLTLQGRSLDQLIVLPALGREIRGGRDLTALFQLTRLIRRVRPDVVHTHTAKAGVLGRLAALLARVPVIVHTYHGHVFHGYFPAPKARVFLAIERWLGRRTDRLVAVSATVRSELLALGVGSPERLTVVPPGLPLARFLDCETLRGSLRAELGLPDAGPLVGIVARLVAIKAHEVFLAAAAVVARNVPAARFLVIGDGERRRELERLVERAGLTQRVHFLGWRADLARLYADLDIVALASRNEGSPISVIEAMASARPVVATRVGGVPDLLEDGVTGLLVPSGDARAMAHAMQSLLEDPARRREMGAAGRKRVAGQFAADRLLVEVDRLYTELLRVKASRTAAAAGAGYAGAE